MLVQKVMNVKFMMYNIHTKQNKEAKAGDGRCTLGVKSVGKSSGWENIFMIIGIEY